MTSFVVQGHIPFKNMELVYTIMPNILTSDQRFKYMLHCVKYVQHWYKLHN